MARHKGFSPDAALDEAMLAFWTTGFEGTSTQTLVDRMGIGKRSLYDTFGDKKSLYLDALRRYVARADEHEDRAVDSSPDAAVALLTLLTPDPSLGERPPGCFVALAATEATPDDDAVRGVVEAHLDRSRGRVAQLLTRLGVPAGEVAALAQVVQDAALGVRVRSRSGLARDGDLERIVATAAARAASRGD